MDPIVIGTGALWWTRYERQTDRYGAVHLVDPADNTLTIDTSLVGKRGRLVAVVQELRPSQHIGDLASGHGKTKPLAVGDVVELGAGTLFVESSRDGDTEVGLKPDDGRDENWLDPKALYNCHAQVVRLELHPEAP